MAASASHAAALVAGMRPPVPEPAPAPSPQRRAKGTRHTSVDADPTFQANKVWRRRKSLLRRRSLLLDSIVGDDIAEAVAAHDKASAGPGSMPPPTPLRSSSGGTTARSRASRARLSPVQRPATSGGEPPVPVAFGRTNPSRRRGTRGSGILKSQLYSPLSATRRRSRVARATTPKHSRRPELAASTRPASAAAGRGRLNKSKSVPAMRRRTADSPRTDIGSVSNASPRTLGVGGDSGDDVGAAGNDSPTRKAAAARHRAASVQLESAVDVYDKPGLVFPDALRKRADFQSLLNANINAVHGRRHAAAHFLKFVAGIDTELSMEHYTGPARSRRLRRDAILDVSRSQRSTEPTVPITPYKEEEGASENKSNGSGALDLPWEGAERDDDDDMGQDQAHVAVKSRTENKFAVPMRSDMDFADAERYLQRAFVVRARTFGINDEATAAARTNLLKCYIAQNKMDDIREIRDHVKRHILALERNLADFETDLRRSRLREKMMTHARAMGAKSLAAMRDASDSLGLRDDARPVPDRTDLSSPARFHGVFADSRVMEYNALKAAPSPYAAATMVYPQHQAGARRKQQREERARLAAANTPHSSAGRSVGGRTPVAKSPSMQAGSPTSRGTNASPSHGATAGQPTSPSAQHAGAGKQPTDPLRKYDHVRARKVGGDAPPPTDPEVNDSTGMSVSVPVRRYRNDAKEQLALSNFGRAADSCRKGLAQHGGDAALRAMFRASLGKLSEYPRRADFDADLTLGVSQDAILGERLVVKYDYKHRTLPGRRHTPLDWVGLFKVRRTREGDAFVQAFHASQGQAVSTPASRRAHARKRTGSVDPDADPDAVNAEKSPSSGQKAKPSRSQLTQMVLSSGALSGASKRDYLYQLHVQEEERKRRKAERAKALAEMKANEDPLKALGDPTLNFGEEDVREEHREVLVGWTLVPPENSGSVAFEGLPTEAGHYRVRYFVHGSQCPLGDAADVYARLVDIELDTDSTVFCGDRLSVRYKMHYREARHGPDDWAGLYVIPANEQQEEEVDWTPYVFTHPIEVVKLPPDNEGVVNFVDHPVYPGTYEIRFFIHQDVDSCVGITQPIQARLPFNNFSRNAPLLRELRFYLAAPFTCSDEERDVLARVVMPHIRSVCEERCVTPVLVDLRSQLAHYTGKPKKLGEAVETFFQEIEDCRPMVLVVMGQGYGWIPQGFSSAVSHLFPWVRHHDNPAVPRQELGKRKGGTLLGAMKSMLGSTGKEKATNKVLEKAETAENPDAEKPIPVKASILELEMVSALRLPELQLDGSGAALTAHCHIYTRHPSLHSGVVNLPDPVHIPDPQLPQRVSDAALTHWRNVCAKRGWRCRPGYQNMSELADWVVADVMSAVDEHWPKRKLPPSELLWTMSSMAFAQMRKSFAVVSQLRVAQMQRLTSYATSYSPPNRPFCVVGPSGCGKSALIAVWSALFYHKSRPAAIAANHPALRAARKIININRLAKAVGRKASFASSAGGGDGTKSAASSPHEGKDGGGAATTATTTADAADEDDGTRLQVDTNQAQPASLRVRSPRSTLPGATFHGQGAGTGDGVAGFVRRKTLRGQSKGVDASRGKGKSKVDVSNLTVNTSTPRVAIPSGMGSFHRSSDSAESGHFTFAAEPEDTIDPARDSLYESLPTCPTYFTASIADINFVCMVVHIGENGVPNTAPELMRCIAQALAQLTRCERQAQEVVAAVAGNKGYAQIRAAFHECLEFVLMSYRVVLVLDGLDRMTDCNRPSRGGNAPTAGAGAGASSGGGAGGAGGGAGDDDLDPGAGGDGPPALWWFPSELPLGLHLIFTVRRYGVGWGTVEARGWSRDRIDIPSLSKNEAKEIMRRALGRGGCGNEWSQNHGTRLRYWLELPVSTRNMEVLAADAMRIAKLPPSKQQRTKEVVGALGALASASKKTTGGGAAKQSPANQQPPPGPTPDQLVAKLVGEPLLKVLLTWFSAFEQCRRPLWLRIAIARLCTTRTTVAALATAKMLVEEDLSAMISHLLRDCRHPLALDALRLILVSRCGLSECELVDMLGGARYRRRERRSSMIVTPGQLEHASKLDATFYSASQQERQAQLGHHFDAVAWSRARRWLLAAFIGRGRGLWNIDHPVVHEAVVAQLLPDYKSAIPWLQRLCAYMWTQPAGRRKAEELPTALMQLTKHAERLEVIREAREESRLARTSSTAAGRMGSTRRAANRRNSIGVVMHVLNAARRPSSLIVGMPLHDAFPLDVKRCHDRLLQCLQDVALVSELRSSGAEMRNILTQGLKLVGKPATTIISLMRQSFEHYHGITGFQRRPHYQLARNALIDPDFLKHQEEEKQRQQEREAKMRSSKKREVWAPRRKQDTSNWVRVTAEGWEHLRRVGCRQLVHVAYLFDELGVMAPAYTTAETSVLLNFGFKYWDTMITTLKAEAAAEGAGNDATASPGNNGGAANLISKRSASHALLLIARLLYKRLLYMVAKEQSSGRADKPASPARRLRNAPQQMLLAITEMNAQQLFGRLRGMRFLFAVLERLTLANADTAEALEIFGKAQRVVAQAFSRRGAKYPRMYKAAKLVAATQQAARRSRVAAERKVQEQERRKEGAMKKAAVDTEQAAATATSKRRASSVRSSRRRSSARRSSGVGHRRSVSPTRGQVAALGHIAE